MNKKQLATRLARQSHRSKGQAADEVDNFVYSLLKDLKASETQRSAEEPSSAPPVDPAVGKSADAAKAADEEQR